MVPTRRGRIRQADTNINKQTQWLSWNTMSSKGNFYFILSENERDDIVFENLILCIYMNRHIFFVALWPLLSFRICILCSLFKKDV